MQKQPLHLDLMPLDLVWNDPVRNVAQMEKAIATRLKEASETESQSRIFVFPELTLTGFVTDHPEKVALDRDATAVQAVLSLAKKFRVAIVFGFPERRSPEKGDKPYNTLLFVSPDGEVVADYQKLHLFTVGNPSEKSVYQAGETGALVHYRGWKIGFGICFDLRFPSLFHAYAENGAELVILPACWLGGPGKADQFESLTKAHAIMGQCFFAALNRSGKDPTASYEGDVLCFSPKGVPISAQSGFSLNPALIADARKLELRVSDLEGYPVIRMNEELE